jgi:hypothetical protein
MVEREPERPLSPELVLVSPDLRERALLEEERAAPVPPQADVDPPTASVAPAPRVQLPSPSAPPPRAEASAGPGGRRLTAGAATAIALIALIVFGAGVAIGKLAFPSSTARSPVAPRVASPKPPVTASVPRTSSSASTTPPATSTARSSAAPRVASPKPPVTASVPRTSSAPTTLPVRQPRPSTTPPPAKTLPPRTLRPTPNGGYVFSGGTFRLSGTGRRILDFTLRTTCSGPLTLPPIQVAATGTFTFSGKPPGALPGTTVRVTGRFVSPVAARGTTRVTRRTCHGPATPFAAQLS